MGFGPNQTHSKTPGTIIPAFSLSLYVYTLEPRMKRHEELLPRKLVVPQVNQLVQVAQKSQSTIFESGSDGVSQHDLQSNSNMVLTAGLGTYTIEGNDKGFEEAYKMMMDELKDGGKVYLVYPIIELSEQLPQLRAASANLKSISDRFPGYNCGLLHGRMRNEEESTI
ncbi:hypothetical protein KIW84_056055 [Lathyrus oleraceus]|uniref:Uncharacterized protein n=1 Tax=Pisum sativum TaxID=3888 RepID=A0A9D4WZQ5_PEA|nr:hypothetical protein KIW84_056055 [Pisum sativum]